MHRIPTPRDPAVEPVSALRLAGPARSPADLEAHEHQLAEVFGSLRRLDCGPELLEAIQPRLAADAHPLRPVASGGRFVAVGMAAAAVLLLAIGAIALQGAATSAAGTPAVEARAASSGALVLEDPNMTLFHGLETFDGVSVEPGDLLALGDE